MVVGETERRLGKAVVENLTATIVCRLIGSAGGSAIALVIVQPTSLRGFLQRSFVSVSSGLMLTPVLQSYLRWGSHPDDIIAAACIVGACSWWTWHAIIRAAQAGWIPWVRKKD